MLLEKLAEFEEARSKSGSLPRTTERSTSSSLLKIEDCLNRQQERRWDHHLSIESLARTNSTLKASARAKGPEDTISLGVARPLSQYYPWEKLEIHGLATTLRGNDIGVEIAAKTSCAKGDRPYDLASALNYGASAGSPQLLQFITEHVRSVHAPPYADWECSLTCGTTSALEIVFRMLCNRGDTILTEEYTYSGAVEVAMPLGLAVVGIEIDSDGLLPDSLDSTLRDWDSVLGPKPRVLYTIPTGQNPTGTTQPATRRKAIYQVAELHDLLIVEDDPYYLLPLVSKLGNLRSDENEEISPDAFLKMLPPSYVSLDTSGRVIRLDTASKILAPGLRIGWITACSQLIEKFLNHSEFSTTSPSGPSQVTMYKLLGESWGHTGFVKWLTYLSLEYSRRLDVVIKACESRLPLEICSWTAPTFGMFVWIGIDWTRHPVARTSVRAEEAEASCASVEERLYQRAKRNGVQISKGSWFGVRKQSPPRMHFRITFAAAPQEKDLEEAVARFGRAIREEFEPDVCSIEL